MFPKASAGQFYGFESYAVDTNADWYDLQGIVSKCTYTLVKNSGMEQRSNRQE